VFAGSIVRLLVGKSVCPLSVHFRLLRARSPFFECLLADWSDSDDEPVRLPDAEAEVFDQFLGWLYTDCIDVRRKKGEWLSLCKLWVLAETFKVRPAPPSHMVLGSSTNNGGPLVVTTIIVVTNEA
jgi:hypothetical protein